MHVKRVRDKKCNGANGGKLLTGAKLSAAMKMNCSNVRSWPEPRSPLRGGKEESKEEEEEEEKEEEESERERESVVTKKSAEEQRSDNSPVNNTQTHV